MLILLCISIIGMRLEWMAIHIENIEEKIETKEPRP